MNWIQMMKGATKLVETCANVKKGENVLIVTDINKLNIAEVVASAAVEKGAEVVISIMLPRQMHGEEPPDTIAESMKKADVIFTPTTFSIAQTKARTEAQKYGARVVNMPAFTEEMLISGGIEVDFLAQKPIAERIAQLLTDAKRARVTSQAGTDIVMSLEGREGFACTGLAHDKGSYTPVPDIESRIAPVEGTAKGSIVVDGSVPIPGIGLISEYIIVVVEKGIATEISGGREAEVLKETLANSRDQNVYNIAELGIGLNPKAHLIGDMLEDEGSFGTIHIALGTNSSFGGKTSAPLHIDMMIRNPTLYLDDAMIMKEGQLLSSTMQNEEF
jgi:leucyl aminopeptidase (aminopeptidase T)